MRRFAAAAVVVLMGFTLSYARQDDTKIERGVQAHAPVPAPVAKAKVEEAPPKVSKDLMPLPALIVAVIGTILVIGAICIPINKSEDDDD